MDLAIQGRVVGDQRRFVQSGQNVKALHSGQIVRRLPLLFLCALLPILIELEIKVRFDGVLVTLLDPILCELSV